MLPTQVFQVEILSNLPEPRAGLM